LLNVLKSRLEVVGRTPATARHENCRSSRADRFDAVYLRAAQAYMLISMPTGTSTILGAFQVISFSQVVSSRFLQVVWRELCARFEPKSTLDITQVRRIEDRTPTFLSWTTQLRSWTRRS
jgi:hypothetical protein